MPSSRSAPIVKPLLLFSLLSLLSLLCLGAVAVTIAAIAAWNGGKRPGGATADAPARAVPAGAVPQQAAPAVVGAAAEGLPAPSPTVASASTPVVPPRSSPPPPQSSPPAPAGPAAGALAQAHLTGEEPEQTSPLLAPPPFDAQAFAQDPAPYLQRVVPGRVFQPAAPGPGVPVPGAHGPATHVVAHGDACDLSARAPAGAPVTYTTFDLGLFDNGLTSITVQAGQDGVATARLSAVGEVIGDVHVLAGSPLASGQVKFVVSVRPPPPSTAGK